MAGPSVQWRNGFVPTFCGWNKDIKAKKRETTRRGTHRITRSRSRPLLAVKGPAWARRSSLAAIQGRVHQRSQQLVRCGDYEQAEGYRARKPAPDHHPRSV